MILNSKLNHQRSQDKQDNRESRNKPLPVLLQESPLEIDPCPFQPRLNQYTSPLNLNSILIRMGAQNRGSGPNISRLYSIEPPNSNSNSLEILMRLVISQVELERVTEGKQGLKRQGGQGAVWKEKYQDILQRYKQGETSFYRLAQKNKQLQNEVRYSIQASSEQAVASKDTEIRNLQSQLKVAREVSESNIGILESSNKRLEGERIRLCQLLESSNLEGQRLEKELNLGMAQTPSRQDQIDHLQGQLIYSKQQLKLAQEERANMYRNSESLKLELESERLHTKSINLEVIEQRQRVEVQKQECRRLDNEILRLSQKLVGSQSLQAARVETQNRLREEIGHLKLEVSSVEGRVSELNGLRSELQFTRSQNEALTSQIYVLQRLTCQQKQTNVRLEAQLRSPSILISYESLKRQVEQTRLDHQLERVELSNRIRLLQREVQYVQSQKTASDGLIDKLRSENRELARELDKQGDTELLKKHLELSIQQISRVYNCSKYVISELRGRSVWLAKEKEEFLRKQQYQEFELEKLYEVLKTRKEELETCYRTIEGLRKGGETAEQGHQLNQMLRNRREQLL